MFFKLSKKAQNLLLFCLNSYLGVCTFKKKKTGRNSVVERNKVPNRGEVVRVNAESKNRKIEREGVRKWDREGEYTSATDEMEVRGCRRCW